MQRHPRGGSASDLLATAISKESTAEGNSDPCPKTSDWPDLEGKSRGRPFFDSMASVIERVRAPALTPDDAISSLPQAVDFLNSVEAVLPAYRYGLFS